MEPAHGHWSMTVLRRGPPTHCLLWRTTPRVPPWPWKHYFPNIGELLQRTRSLPFNSVCFPERNTSKTAFHRIIIGSSWILTKAQNPFMLEKPRRNFLERSQISLLLLFLSSSLLIFLIFFQVPAIIVSDTGDGQTGGGQWKSVKVQNADSSLFSSFPSPCFERLWICHWRVKVFCRLQKEFSFTQGQTLLPGMANKETGKKEVENKWNRSQTELKMALFVVPPQK